MKLRVALADDHPIVLDGLEALFRLEPDFAVVARCRDGHQAVEEVLALRPDVLVLDVRMPGADGLEVVAALREQGSETRVVLLTAALDQDQLRRAVDELEVGGVVLKEMAPSFLVAAVRAVAAGGRWLEEGSVGPALRRLAERDDAAREATAALTSRELEIVRMVARGLRNRAVAEKLFISEGTVKIHLHNIYRKLAIDGRLELSLYAQTHGLA